MTTGQAAPILKRDERTIGRWVDAKLLRGGRVIDPTTGQPIANSRRWVDARQVVAAAVAAGLEWNIPEQWRGLISRDPAPQVSVPTPREGEPDDNAG